MKKKKKLSLNELKVKSFITGNPLKTNTVKGGTLSVIVVTVIANCSGNCGTAINVTCDAGCDFRSIPLNECFGGSGNCGSNDCSGNGCGSGSGEDTCTNAL